MDILKHSTQSPDNGSGYRSNIVNQVRKAIFPTLQLHGQELHLKAYIEEKIKVIGKLHVIVKYCNQEAKLVLIVVQGQGHILFG